ncbi:MAG: DUF547 domain-containing protein [Pseudomonadota bacterium]
MRAGLTRLPLCGGLSRIIAPLALGAFGSAALCAQSPVAGGDGAAIFVDGLSPARFDIFTPTQSPVRHRIEYDIWDFALKQLVISMGPSTRQTARPAQQMLGTRQRQGHNSRYRLEGSMLGFYFLDDRAIASFGEYRRELESVADGLDISTLPRNEQLAFWFNLHNVAMVEKIAENWPFRQPRRLLIDGVVLDEAKFITVRGVAMSLRDIREKIVFANWRDPKVIYGFWRGEIGGPALERAAFTGANVSSLLSLKAEEYINSLRGTQKRGKTLDVATIYEEVSAFYFPDFAADIRAHIAEYAQEDVAKILAKTTATEANIREYDIADLNGGRRDSIALVNAGAGMPYSIGQLIIQRQRKLDRIERKEGRTGRVYFTEIALPGQDPNAGQVE